jgi:hypothetical protein
MADIPNAKEVYLRAMTEEERRLYTIDTLNTIADEVTRSAVM